MPSRPPPGAAPASLAEVRRRVTRWLLVAVGACAALAFLPSLLAGFVFDDIPLIVDNEFLHRWEFLLRTFRTHLWDVSRVAAGEAELGEVGAVNRYYRPLVTLSYQLNWMAAPGVAWPFHLVNVALHAVASALAAWLALRWTRSFALALALGGLMALHPTRVENVTWISGRTDLLMLPLLLGAVLALRRARRCAPGSIGWFVGALALFVLAVLSKEPAAMLPLVVLADASARRLRWRSVTFLVPAAVGAAYLAARSLFYPIEPPDVLRTPTPTHALMTLGSYATRVAWPWPQTMYYQCLEFADGVARYPPGLVGLGGLVALGSLSLAVLTWRREPRVALALLAAAAFLGPLLNVYFTGMNVSAQDRFLYAPLFFFALAVALAFRRALLRAARLRAVRLLAAGTALAWAGLVVARTADYRDDATFWRSELVHNPENPYVLSHNARVLASEGNLAEAYRLLGVALSPEAARFDLFIRRSFLARTHYQRVILKAALLPDGRARELDELAREFTRVLDPEARVPGRVVEDLPLGVPFTERTLRALQASRIGLYEGEGALLATRVGDFGLARALLARETPVRSALAPSPLNVVLAHARVGDRARAEELLALLERRARAGSPAPSADDISATRQRVARAFGAEGGGEPHALHLAELGAYLAALRRLAADGEVPEAQRPFLAQLLLSARLDQAALQVTSEALGPERAGELVAGWRAALPPALAAYPAVPGTDWRGAIRRRGALAPR